MSQQDINELSKSERRKQIRKNNVKEYWKCARDPSYFMRNYCYIKSQEEGNLVLFDLYDFQKRALKEFLAYEYNTVLKTRQMGISTLCAGYSLWLALFHNDTDISYIATKQDVAQGLLKKVKLMHDNLPSFMQERKERDNLHSLELGNGSLIKANSSASDAGRSESLALLVIDEAAFIDNAQEVWSSAKPTLSGGGEAIVLSTPYGVGSWYHQIWTEAVQGSSLVDDTENQEVWKGTGVNDFHPIKLHWSLHPNRDEEWREKMGKNMEPREAAREYDCMGEGTEVFTEHSGLKPIEKVKVGDKVLTHRDRYAPVSGTRTVYRSSAVKIVTGRGEEIMSPGHGVLCSGGFVRAENVEEGDLVARRPIQGKGWSWEHANKVECVSGRKLYDLQVSGDASFVTGNVVSHNCSFEQSGNTVIDPQDIKDINGSTVRDPEYKVRVRGQNALWVWEDPDPEKRYVMGADVASGEGADYSTAEVFTLEGMEQVAEYKGKMLPSDFGDFLCRLGGKYNTAALVCERNNVGRSVLQQVHDNGYSNMLWSTNNLEFVSLSEDRGSSRKMYPGIKTTGKTKQLITTKFNEWVRKRHVTVRSQRLLDEFKTYVWVKPNKADHMDGYHDDLIDATRFAIWARDTAIRLESEKKAAVEQSVKNIMTSKSAKEKSGENDGHKGIYSPKSSGPRDGEDYSWLY